MMDDDLALMSAQVHDALITCFTDDSDNYIGDVKHVDLTKFFTAYLYGGCILFNHLTGDDKNYLEFTHVLQTLFVQSLDDGKHAKKE